MSGPYVKTSISHEEAVGYIQNYETNIWYSKEAKTMKNLYQVVALELNEDGEREGIIDNDLLLAESEEKVREKFVQQLGSEYDADSDEIEVGTFL